MSMGDDLDHINQRNRHTSCWRHHSVCRVPGERELSVAIHFPLVLTGHNVSKCDQPLQAPAARLLCPDELYLDM